MKIARNQRIKDYKITQGKEHEQHSKLLQERSNKEWQLMNEKEEKEAVIKSEESDW